MLNFNYWYPTLADDKWFTANFYRPLSLFLTRYANRAKNIKNKPHINEDPKDALLREYQEEIVRLKSALVKRKTKGKGKKSRRRVNSSGEGTSYRMTITHMHPHTQPHPHTHTSGEW